MTLTPRYRDIRIMALILVGCERRGNHLPRTKLVGKIKRANEVVEQIDNASINLSIHPLAHYRTLKLPSPSRPQTPPGGVEICKYDIIHTHTHTYTNMQADRLQR